MNIKIGAFTFFSFVMIANLEGTRSRAVAADRLNFLAAAQRGVEEADALEAQDEGQANQSEISFGTMYLDAVLRLKQEIRKIERLLSDFRRGPKTACERDALKDDLASYRQALERGYRLAGLSLEEKAE